MAYALSEKSKANREGVDPRLIEISDRAIEITKMDFGHGPDSGLRTAVRQNELFAAGKSRCNGFDTISRHQSGKALDVTAYVGGRPNWDHKQYAMIAVAFLTAANELGYKLKWGGMFSQNVIVNGITYGWDCPHFELEG